MRSKSPLLNILVILTFSWFSPAGSEPVEITYIANEGFLISSGSHKVLVDALFDDGLGYCLTPARSTRNELTNALPPFDKVDLILVTHSHADHFNGKMVAAHLENNPHGILVAPQQVVETLRERKDFEKIARRVEEVTPEYGTVMEKTINGVVLKVFGMKHVRYPVDGIDKHADVQNVGFSISIGDVTVFHPGDAIFDLDEEFVISSQFDKEHIDILFVKYFDRSQGAEHMVKNVIRPNKIVAMHIPPKEIESVSDTFRLTYPAGIIFNKSMEKMVVTVSRSEG